MQYLIDTHILLFSIIKPSSLPGNIKTEIEKEDNQIFVSSISLWEISLKYSLGKLKLKGFLPEDLIEIILKTGFDIITPTPEIFATFHKLPKLTKDPFDRMLIWQAINNNLTFITVDKELKTYKKFGLKIFPK